MFRKAFPASIVLFLSLFLIAPTAEAATPAPGGIDTSLQLWLHSDTGLSSTVSGGMVTTWNDQSGGGRNVTQATDSKKPTYNTASSSNAFNFHATLTFASSTNRFFESTAQDTLASDSPYTMFMVLKTTATSSSQNLMGAGELAGTYAITMTSTEDRPKLFHNATQLSGTSNILGYSPGMVVTRYAGGGGRGVVSTSGTQTTTANVATHVGGTTIEIGNYHGSATASMNGYLAEVAVYNRELSFDDIQKVQSALALKYGITFRGWNYVSSAGTTYFSTTTNAGYVSNIFGLGKDTNAGVDQKVSKSMGTSTIMTVATTQDFTNANSDAARTSLTEGTFFVLGSNATTTAFESRYDGQPNSRMNRIWKVQETGTVGSIYVAIPNTISFPSGTPQVIISSDAVFSHTDTAVNLSNDGTYYYAQINPSDGQYISFGALSSVSCASYDNVFYSSCATTVYLSQYDTDLATGNWLSPLGDSGTATYTAHNATELATYTNTLAPGDILELANGTWSDAINLEFNVPGTALNPITIRAQDPGGVIFTGAVRLYLLGDYARFEGFKFQGTYEHPDSGNSITNLNMGRSGASCDHCLVSNVSFDNYNNSSTTERVHRVRSAGQWNTVASSTFTGKTDEGVEIVLYDNQTGTTPTGLDYLLIKGNYFYDREEAVINGSEALRLGDSSLSRSESRSYVIGNLFEDYTGETELVSLKRDNITIRGNTFLNSGHVPVVFRQSASSTMEANIIDGEGSADLGGTRANGSGHSVMHNVFQNLDSTGHTSSFTPLTLYKGENTGGGSDYLPISSFYYGFNTLYNNTNVAYSAGTPSGLSVPVYPTGVKYGFNVGVSSTSTAAYSIDSSSGVSFAGNVFNGSTIGLSDTTGFDTVTNAQVTLHNGVAYSDASVLDFTLKPYRAYYAEMGMSTSTLFKLQYVNSAPESPLVFSKLTSAVTGASYDTTTPTLSNISKGSLDHTSVTIAWTTDKPSTSKIVYGTTSAYGSMSLLDAVTPVTSHQVTLTGLSPATTYHYAVVSSDVINNTSTSSDATFTTSSREGRIKINASPLVTTPSPVTIPVLTGTSLLVAPSLGSENQYVRTLQMLLARDASLYPSAKITGYYGPLTKEAVGRFQMRYAITTKDASNYGLVGPQTLAKLNEVFGASSPAPTLPQKALSSTTSTVTSDLTMGAEGVSVRALQTFLVGQQKGPAATALKTKGVTGYFGPLTKQALAEYQQAVGIIPATGYFGSKTRAYLTAQGISL